MHGRILQALNGGAPDQREVALATAVEIAGYRSEVGIVFCARALLEERPMTRTPRSSQFQFGVKDLNSRIPAPDFPGDKSLK